MAVAEMVVLATLSNTGCHSAPAYQNWWESAHPRCRNGTEMAPWILVMWHFWSRNPIHGVIWVKSLNPGRSCGNLFKIQHGSRPPFL